MAEPPYKRARRPDSKQMWDEADRRAPPPHPNAPLPSRERDEPRDRDRRDDRRRYRSRSRERRRDDRDIRDSRGGRDDRGGRDRRDDRTRGKIPAPEVLLAYRPKPDVNASCEDGPRDRDRERDGRDRGRDSGRDREKRRSRSKSPRRERDRDDRRDDRRDRDRDRDSRTGDKEREKSKSLKPEEITEGRTETPPVSFKVGASGAHEHDRMDVDSRNKRGGSKEKSEDVDDDDDELVVEDDGMAAMQAMMGFGSFNTTHQKKVLGNDISAVRKEKKTEYRQYMNRVGGFNRPLSPTREL
ncbi:hypothetical protein G7Y89_g9163 [Cudoniella acicularis]|uniref:U4/U6.U5 small nuclear ribonucleoprotein 27kDa protein domain-containing protein n=1 Tax=Cudoniella acicularis TaxID=354080 RepID=A0A8H4RIW9_9HELO|nr:hypothetical protein G7Y89_g9163 [Cudoniella acicularis]